MMFWTSFELSQKVIWMGALSPLHPPMHLVEGRSYSVDHILIINSAEYIMLKGHQGYFLENMFCTKKEYGKINKQIKHILD